MESFAGSADLIIFFAASNIVVLRMERVGEKRFEKVLIDKRAPIGVFIKKINKHKFEDLISDLWRQSTEGALSILGGIACGLLRIVNGSGYLWLAYKVSL